MQIPGVEPMTSSSRSVKQVSFCCVVAVMHVQSAEAPSQIPDDMHDCGLYCSGTLADSRQLLPQRCKCCCRAVHQPLCLKVIPQGWLSNMSPCMQVKQRWKLGQPMGRPPQGWQMTMSTCVSLQHMICCKPPWPTARQHPSNGPSSAQSGR